jgi:prolyl oligopeptidase
MIRFVVASALALTSLVVSIAAPPPWTPQQMMQVKRVGGVYPSPPIPSSDGRHITYRIAYTLRESVMDDTRSEVVTQIHLCDVDGGNHLQLTRGAHSSDDPEWSPDGTQIAFISNRTGKQNLWLINVAGGEAEQLTDVKSGVSSFQWSPDGHSIAYTAVDPPSLDEETRNRLKSDVHLVDEQVKHSRLHVIPVAKDPHGQRVARLLTIEDLSVTPDSFDWSTDGSKIVFAHTRTTKVDDWPTSDISLVDVKTAKVTPFLHTPAAELSPKFSPDGKWIVFVKSDNPVTWGQVGNVYMANVSNGNLRKLAPTPDQRPTVIGWAGNGELICGEVRGTHSQLYSLLPNGSGSAKPISNWEGLASAGVHMSHDGRLMGFAWEWPDKPPEIYLSSTSTFQPIIISRLNRSLPKSPIGDTQVIHWKSTDKQEIEGLLTYPVGYREGQRYPLLLVIHGGPAGVFLQNFIADPYPYPVAAFAARGYAVLRANPRGSSGYGRDFRYANYKDWGGKDYQDLMTGVDHVIEMGVADKDKLGVMGWSYGGFMTSWVITHTDRFKAASVGAGVTDLVSFTGTADIQGFLPDYFGGEHWNTDQIYREHSPITHVKGVKTPTLIEHGAADERVPLSQGMELYHALKRQGCVVKMAIYPRSPHAISEPRLFLDVMNRNLEWFDQYVRGVSPQTVAVVPTTRTDNIKETLHGVEITDPYRWLEGSKSPETRAWLAEQSKYMRATLDPLPGREAVAKRLGELLKIDNMSTPTIRGDRWFFSRRRADQEQPIFIVRQGKDGKDEVLLDCNTLSPDKTVSAQPLDVSDDGKIWVYGLRQGGEDEVVVKLRDVDTKSDLSDSLPRARYAGVALTPDKTKLYFARMTKAGPRVYVRKLGEDAETEIFGKGYGPDKYIGVSMSEGGKYLLITVSHGSAAVKTELYVVDLKTDSLTTIVNDIQARFGGQIAADTLFMQTNWNAPNNKLLAVDLRHPERDQWKVIVPEGKSVMERFGLIDHKIFVSYLENVASKELILAPDGKQLGEVKFPAIGTGGVSGRWNQKQAFLNFTNFITPGTSYFYDPDKGIGEVWFRPNIPVDSDSFVVKQVRFKSKDGTEIPMFIVHKKGMNLDGNNPAYLTGYGGFNLSRTPLFSATIAFWCEQGGVYALPSLRGGGEFGEAWHKAGMLANKQNVFDDFIAAAEYLVIRQYTRPDKLAIAGGSNGGLLVGAALTQRPDLFRAVICSVPLLDMLRYHQFLIARFWVPEYGSSEDPEQFKWLLAYSPYQKVKNGEKYPAVMFVTGDSDTRVDPLHARKMCARLQAATASGPDRPVLLHYDAKAGHSAGKPVSKQIDDFVDEYSFLFSQLGVTVK